MDFCVLGLGTYVRARLVFVFCSGVTFGRVNLWSDLTFGRNFGLVLGKTIDRY